MAACEPRINVETEQVATPETTATDEHPVIGVPPSEKLTAPVASADETVAVSTTAWP